MSQAGLLDVETSHPQIPTSFTTDSGTAVPLLNDLEILGSGVIETSASGKTVTISLPNPVTVPLGGTGVVTLEDGGILLGSGVGVVTVTNRPINGELLMGVTGSDPILQTLTADTGIQIQNGEGSISISVTDAVAVSYAADSGTAEAVLNVITIAGDATQGSVTSATGGTVTITNTQAATGQIGVAAFATTAEATAGSSTTKTIVPFSLNTKLGAMTQYGVITGGSSTGNLEATSAMTNGMLAIGSTSATPIAATLTAGTGVSIVNASGSITINASGDFIWNEETGTSATMTVANGYVSNNGSLVTFTLPDTAAFGDRVRVAGKGAGLWKVAQNAGETIHFINSDTTTGTSGSITAIEQYAAMELLCITANTDWEVIDSVGNFTIA